MVNFRELGTKQTITGESRTVFRAFLPRKMRQILIGSRPGLDSVDGEQGGAFVRSMFRRPVNYAVFCVIFLFTAPGVRAEEPIRGFISVEPFEFRLEALVRVNAFKEAWRMETDSIGPAERQGIMDNMLILFESGVNLKIPGESLTFTERSVRFVVPDVEKGYASDDRESIPLEEALVGLTLSATTLGIDEMEFEWLWFAPGQERLFVEIASRGKPSARALTPVANKARWRLDEGISLPALLSVPPVKRIEHHPFRYLLYPGLAMMIYAGFIVTRRKTQSPPWAGWLIIGGVSVCFAALKIRGSELVLPADREKEDLVYALLRNTYHAFDFRDESAIYDTLEASVTGPLLEQVYLEMRSSLELENAGGPRVRVNEIALRECREIEDSHPPGGSFKTRAGWVTIGEVTHWGHTHERTNKYEAEMTISSEGEVWRISGLDLLNEERVQKISRRAIDPEP